jgi:glycosyltransferase involved in cell wall biosynthesis
MEFNPPPKKIVFITTGLSTGGAEIMLYRILQRIDRDKFAPSVISLLGGGKIGEKISKLDIPVHYVNLRKDFSIVKSMVVLTSIAKEINPDKIQGWMYHGNLAAQLLGLFVLKKTEIFWSIHNTNPEVEKNSTRLLGAILRFLSIYPKRILYVSEASRQQHEENGFVRHSSLVIPNGFDLDKFQPSKDLRCRFREELGVSNDAFLIGLIARFHPMKDHSNFLHASAILCRESKNVYFVLAGSDVDYQNPALVNLINKLNIQDSVFLLGERQDTELINAGLDVSTVSSAYAESFPLVIGEAMASGVPCVVTNIGASAEIVGQTGVVVEPKSPESLAQGWLTILTLSPEERAQLGALARARVIDLFALGRIIEQYESLYTSN